MMKNIDIKNIIHKYKNNICLLLIISMIFSLSHGVSMYAGQWVVSPQGMIMYMGENGKFAMNEWRWIDRDGDSIAECYRFGPGGYMLASAYAPDGKFVNANGQWEEDGEVKQVYFSNLKPVVKRIKYLQVEDDKVGIVTGSDVRRVNATGKDLDQLLSNKRSKKNGGKTQYKAPKIGSMSIADDGYVYSGKKRLRPQADGIRGQVLMTFEKEEAIQTTTGSTTRNLSGNDLSKKVTASKNFTKDVESAKIWGGDIWEHCMCLAGNESYLKVALEGANYMRVEVAHQTHGKSTAETVCYLELWIDGEFIDSYDSFVDGEPLVIEEWFDDGEKTFELHWVVESGSQGRKLYLRDGRIRKIRYDD
ncbi:MAG: hypothetical protein MJ151_01200 [Lachnospiraceae bacterium]|nr:hypothetical protein [Lachnospiraceae bacterium]